MWGFPRMNKYATKDTSNKEVINTLFNKMQSKFKDKDYFTCSNVTYNKLCGFRLINALKPIFNEYLKLGWIKEGDKKGRFIFNNPPKEEEEAFNEDSFTESYRDELEEEIRNHKRFLITTAVVRKEVNSPFVEAIKNYAKRNDALVLILPSDIANSTKEEEKTVELDPKLKDFKIVYKDVYLNKNLCLCTIKTSAKQIQTLTGLARIATKKEASVIVASTKHFLEYVPNRHDEVPLALMTTGAITVNNYDTDKYMSKRTAYLAENDHIYGAVVVDVEDDSIFHFRHITATPEGSFVDLGIQYNPDGTTEQLEHSVFVMGDSHTESIDKNLHDSVMDFVDEMNVDTVILHDIFNGASITHHDNGKYLTKGIKAIEGKLSLEKECIGVKRYLEVVLSHVRKVIVVSSNHDRHLDRYLDEGRFLQDPINLQLALELASAFMKKLNPLQYMIEEKLNLKTPNIKWLKEDESFKKYSIEFGVHGDSGANGARGSLTTFEKGLCNCVTAHTHTAKIIRNSCSVGTVSKTDMGYNHGLSNWTHTCALCYNNGTKQLINFIMNKKGEYSCRVL